MSLGWIAQTAGDGGTESVPTISADSVLSPYIYVFYAAFLFSFFLTR